ncbi:uncharacterized protein LOC133910019 [Phragmites australis]|uniref:uncharacterized protein LOC133910019 n=1 Tax=Phragmites australis TaxID=29695 RepID=UPI002D777292|nr:uncharacterized protein LOC133910019 [Phragmites australis]
MAMAAELDIAPVAISPAAGAAVRQRRGWLRRMYSPVGADQETAPRTMEPADATDDGKDRQRARRGWLRRLVPREHALRGRRWKLSGASSRLAAALPRWKRMPGLSVGGGWAPALLDAVAFRVMYVVEAVVLGLALSCFFCCCGCQI